MKRKLQSDIAKVIEYRLFGDWENYHKLIDKLLTELKEYRHHDDHM